MQLSADVSSISAENWTHEIKVGRIPQIPAIPRGKASVPTSRQLAGFGETTGHHGPEPGQVAGCPLPTQWLTDERIAEARRVWSKTYGRVISDDEAIEILMNVRRLAEILLRAEEEKEENECHSLGAGFVP
jgi:hypothetical protein